MTNRKLFRPEVKQVSRQWVYENCKNITDRDIGLIRTIYDNNRRLLRRDQLERLYPHFASTDRLNKRMNMLYRKYVIDKVYPQVGLGEGSSQQHICLDKAGIILLGIDKYNKPITSEPDGTKKLFLGWEHKIMINEYECILADVIKETNGEMIDYQAEESLEYKETKLIPDIFCYFRIGKYGYMFFIEVDMGTEDMAHVKEKLDKYRDYYTSRAWLKMTWAKRKVPVFPLVLFMTTRTGRSKRLKVLKDYTESHMVKFIFGYHDEFIGILDEIIRG